MNLRDKGFSSSMDGYTPQKLKKEIKPAEKKYRKLKQGGEKIVDNENGLVTQKLQPASVTDKFHSRSPSLTKGKPLPPCRLPSA